MSPRTISTTATVPSRAARGSRPAIEALEGRCLLANVPGVFASLGGEVEVPGGAESIVMEVRRADFGFRSGRVLLGFEVRVVDGEALDPAIMGLRARGAGALALRDDVAGGTSAVLLASLRPGRVELIVGGEVGSTGARVVDAYLAGDVNGDFRVSRTDLDLIRSLGGVEIGQSAYQAGADVNRDGRIERDDLELARRNRGVATRLRPLDLTAGLDESSDFDGNGVVTRDDVFITGRTAPSVRVFLDAGGDGTAEIVTRSGRDGRYVFPALLGPGTTDFTITAVDSFGAIASSRFSALLGDVVIDWNETLLDAIRADGTPPPRAARNLAMVQVAVFDAVNAIDKTFAPYAVDAPALPGTSPEAAVAAAAYRVLVGLYPNQTDRFDRALTSTVLELDGNGPGNDLALMAGFNLGMFVGEQVLALRRNDGADLVIPFPGGTAPGDWRPTPPGFLPALFPHWSQLRPFAIATGSQFRPAGYPDLTSAEYARDLAELQSLGRIDSTTRTADQTEIAHFWADGPGTATPPGHWNMIAQDAAARAGTTLVENARLFALLDIALADAGIVAWDAKYAGRPLWRPITAIREADTDGNPLTTANPSWSPLLTTPPFPTYTSGHSTFSGAADAVLTELFGPNAAFVTDSDDLPGVLRQFDSFTQAADEAGRSRIFGGIHFEFDNRDGLASGRALGRFVARNFLGRRA